MPLYSCNSCYYHGPSSRWRLHHARHARSHYWHFDSVFFSWNGLLFHANKNQKVKANNNHQVTVFVVKGWYF